MARRALFRGGKYDDASIVHCERCTNIIIGVRMTDRNEAGEKVLHCGTCSLALFEERRAKEIAEGKVKPAATPTKTTSRVIQWKEKSNA